MDTSKKSNTNKVLGIIIGVVFAIIAVLSVGFLMSGSGSDKVEPAGGSGGVTEPLVTVTYCPEQVNTDNPNFSIEGVVVGDSGPCTLTINGEIVTDVAAGEHKKWAKNYTVKAGDTFSLDIRAKDNNGKEVQVLKKVYCQQLKKVSDLKSKTNYTYTKNTYTGNHIFVKRKPGGLNIRQYAGAYSYIKVIDYITSNDYSSQMIYLGSYSYDNEGNMWYKVISPRGYTGYVRSDLVRSK